jgi:DNA-binding NarL/FixJ family response regulator
MESVIKIGVIDNDQMLLQGMAAWIAGTGDIDLVVTAVDVESYLAQPDLPQIVILDLNLENFTEPADNVALLVEAGAKVIVASVIPDASYIASTTEAGALTYITKNSDLDALAKVIRAVHRGEDPTTPQHAFWLARDRRPDRPQLTSREREVLLAVGTGDTYDAVARRLQIAPSTVKTYLDRVKCKYAEAGRPIKHHGQYSDRIREDQLGRERLGPPPPT